MLTWNLVTHTSSPMFLLFKIIIPTCCPPQPRGFFYSEGVERFSGLCGQKYKQPPAELTRSLCIKTSSGSSLKWSMLDPDLHDVQSHQFLCPI